MDSLQVKDLHKSCNYYALMYEEINSKNQDIIAFIFKKYESAHAQMLKLVFIYM